MAGAAAGVYIWRQSLYLPVEVALVFIFHPQVGRDVSERINHPCATELLPGSLLLLFAAFSHFAVALLVYRFW